MTTQKTFKRRTRARMSKTGEAYTTARTQLIRKADARAKRAVTPAARDRGADVELPVSEAAIRKGSGHGWDHWLRLLDGWGATDRRHAEIARWLREEQGVDGWWAQSITGGYERARGMRAKHQFAEGFAVTANRTINVPVERLMAAFTGAALRRRWLPDAPPLKRRVARATDVARFDWGDPPSRLTAWFEPKGGNKSHVAVEHSHLPDAASAERFKASWRTNLSALKELLEKR
jgi:uncharacterized protein YndB with AHSA1/START domain